MTSHKKHINVPLKLAIIKTGQTARKLAAIARIGEVRLSAIINNHGSPATHAEQSAIIKALTQFGVLQTREVVFAQQEEEVT